MQTNPEINADPLLDLKTVQQAYKLNLSTIKMIVEDDTMPVTWLGKKRYLRQSDLENYFKKHTQTSKKEPQQTSSTSVKEQPAKSSAGQRLKQVLKNSSSTTSKADAFKAKILQATAPKSVA